jgi:Tfp pilus assembly protein PilF
MIWSRLLFVTAAVALAHAQSSAFEGTIRDSHGKAVSAATVSVKADGMEALTTRTDAAGGYHFALHKGTYTLRAESPGTTGASFGPFILKDRETKKVDLTLAPAAAQFYDEPNFTVAGVTDTVNRGGHGSDTVIRSTEALTKATAGLSQQPVATPADEKALRDAIERDPSNAAAHHRLADFEEHRGNSLEAVREYQRAVELDASETNLFDWGSELLTHRAVDQAAAVFAIGNRAFPRSIRMLLALGSALFAQGAYDEAAKRFFEATDLDPADPAPYIFLGRIQNTAITSLDEFLNRMARFAKLEPANAQANYLYAAALWKHWKGPDDRQTAAQVEALLAKALKIDPALSDAHLQLGIVHSTLADFPKAIENYRNAIQAGTQSEEAHYRLAQAYQRTGDAAKARQEFAIYNELSKTSAEEAERQRRRIQQFVFDMRTH